MTLWQPLPVPSTPSVLCLTIWFPDGISAFPQNSHLAMAFFVSGSRDALQLPGEMGQIPVSAIEKPSQSTQPTLLAFGS